MAKIKARDDIDVEQWLDGLDPATTPGRDGKHLRKIGMALTDVEAAEQRLRGAVADARAAGEPWSLIGMVLGTSRQAAFQRFGRADE